MSILNTLRTLRAQRPDLSVELVEVPRDRECELLEAITPCGELHFDLSSHKLTFRDRPIELVAEGAPIRVKFDDPEGYSPQFRPDDPNESIKLVYHKGGAEAVG